METISFFWSFLKMITALGVVVAMMIGALVLIRRYGGHAPATANARSMIRILSTCPLDPRTSFLLLDVLDQLVLVGVSGQGVSTLATITDPAAIEQARKRAMDEGAGPGRDLLARCGSLLRGAALMRKNG